MRKHLAFIRYGLGTQASAFDLWCIATTVIYAFGRPIPWWVWFAFGAELYTVVSNALQYNKEVSK